MFDYTPTGKRNTTLMGMRNVRGGRASWLLLLLSLQCSERESLDWDRNMSITPRDLNHVAPRYTLSVGIEKQQEAGTIW